MKIFSAALAAAIVACGSSGVGAQNFSSAFGGFGSDSDAPIQIESDQLEVRDAEKIAIYSGNVRARQGATLLEAPEMVVFYGGQPEPGEATGSKLSRIEAGPTVVVTSPEQTASGERMVLDMEQDRLTMSGNVVLTEGPNVVRGERLVVNLVTKQGRVEGGRVQTLISPSGGRPAP